jgi:putative (di)nucleoside polyphosphate hydrolase
MLLDQNGEVFVGRRNDLGADAWQMPQGGIDDDEDPRAAAFRELAEETGIRSVEMLAETSGWLTYDYPPSVARRSFANRFRGQRQKWFAMRFTGQEAEIDLGFRHAEFDAWRWRDMEELPGLIVAFKRPVYEAVVREFRHLAPPRI